MNKKSLFLTFSLLLSLTMVLSACSPVAAPIPSTTPAPAAAVTQTAVPASADLILATTTSTQDSGLLDYLIPMFEKEAGVKVKVIAVGSGQALQLGKDGNADVLLVHSPAAEKDFMDKKDGIRREDVMYNDFVITGPESDPAKVKGLTSSTAAFNADELI